MVGSRIAPRTKGERTRATIVATAATLFNVRGYAETSMADVLARTDLQKGGLYNHFASKDELAVAAFEFAAAQFERTHRRAQAAVASAPAKLLATVDVFAAQGRDPILPGGCPLLNTAVRATNGNRRLRDAARRAVRGVIDRLEAIAADGVATGELRADVEPAELATHLFSALEGAVAVARLFDDETHLQRAAARLHVEIRRRCTPRGRARLTQAPQ